MYFADLQSFIAQLEDSGELVKVRASVDPYLETAAIIDRCCKSDGDNRALLFENVQGSMIPLAANLFGSENRTAMALGVTDAGLLMKRLRSDLALLKTKDSAQALVQLVINKDSANLAYVDASSFCIDVSEQGLDVLPVLQSWPGDGGRYITLGQVFTRHPGGGQHNCGMYRIQVLDKCRALLRCHPGSGGAAHMVAWHARGKAMPVAIALGGPPALTWCAGASLPVEVSEIDFASYLTRQIISVAHCQCSDLFVPASAEIVIEGEILPGDLADEGPFGNHTGYYTPISPAPVIRITSLRMREGAVYPCTVVGPPPMENVYLAQAAQRLLLPLLQYDFPWVIDVHMPLQGIYHRAAFVSVEARDLSMAEISKALWQSKLLRKSRLIVLLDSESDLCQAEDVYWRTINADCWQKSVLIDEEKMVIDARNKSVRNKVSSDIATQENATKRCREFGVGES